MTISWSGIILTIVLVIFALVAFALDKRSKKKRAERLQQRRAQLQAKYGVTEIVDRIMNHNYWQGQSPEQLVDSMGNPGDIDQKVLKTKTKEIWKYNSTGKGRYALRITIENGKVIGWDDKS